jgi:hypothetical protein
MSIVQTILTSYIVSTSIVIEIIATEKDMFRYKRKKYLIKCYGSIESSIFPKIHLEIKESKV